MTMTFLRFLNNLRRALTSNRPLGQFPPHRCRPFLEALEDRTVLSTLRINAAGDLFYTAGSGVNNNLVIWLSNGNYNFKDSGETITLKGAGSTNWTGSGTNTVTGPASSVIDMSVDVGDGTDTVTVFSLGVPLALKDSGSGDDTLNVGHKGQVGGIGANINVDNPSGVTALWTINVNDSADTTAHAVTLDSFTNSTDGELWGRIGGLATGKVRYDFANTAKVNLQTGDANNALNVLATGVVTNLVSNNSSSTTNTVTIGNGGTVDQIAGKVLVSTHATGGTSAIVIDDSADTTKRTATLSGFTGAPDGDGDDESWGAVTGLGNTAPIEFEYDDTSLLRIGTGSGNSTFRVYRTDTLTRFFGANPIFFSLGHKGSVQNLEGTTTFNYPSSDGTPSVTLTLDDSADTTARTVTVSTETPSFDPVPYGVISGLAPADLKFEYDDTRRVNIRTGDADNTINVLATGVTTNLMNYGSSSATSTVNVGNNGTVDQIDGKVLVSSIGAGTNDIILDDTSDTTTRTATVSMFTGGPNGDGDIDSWGSVSGFGNAAPVQFEYDDANVLRIGTGSGNSSVRVYSTGTLTRFFGATPVSFKVGHNGSVQDINGTTTFNYPSADGSPSVTLRVDDSADTAARTVTLSTETPAFDPVPYGVISGLAPADLKYEYDDTRRVNILTGDANNTINVLATGVTTNLVSDNSSSTTNTVNIGDSGTVDQIAGKVLVSTAGTGGTSNVIIDDTADTTTRTATLSTFTGAPDGDGDDESWGSVTGFGNTKPIQFEYEDTNLLRIGTGSGNSTVRVYGTGTLTHFHGSDPVTINLGVKGSVQGLNGTTTFNYPSSSGAPSLTLNVNDSADTTGRTMTLSTITPSFDPVPYGDISGLAPGSIKFEYDDTVVANVRLGSGNNQVTLADLPTTRVNVDGGTGTNTLIGPDAGATWTVTAANAGVVGKAHFKEFQNLLGGSGNDSFRLNDGVGVAGVIDGGGGSNWLDYSAYTTGVTVDLTAGTATGAAAGIANLQNVTGGAGDDLLMGNSVGNILIGGGGNDTLIGGSGRSLLIGGAGSDTITGGANGDIVIGDSTTFDAKHAVLLSILGEWQRIDETYAQRLANLRSGSSGLNGSHHLIFGKSVLDDGSVDTLTGDPGSSSDPDWFFQGAGDNVTDADGTEQIQNQNNP
jgi:hypothetical protein